MKEISGGITALLADVFTITDDMAERARKLSDNTLRFIGDISRHQRILDNDAEFVHPHEMLAELRNENKALGAVIRHVRMSGRVSGDTRRRGNLMRIHA
ncbi:hypothetical protein U2P60_02265 [Brucella sp. H1_1004]|uniref:hypothetical protein n=1 Tax=Brucella sp. H1_1004 TaxID=3110109 RepID=UPI0039B56C20